MTASRALLAAGVTVGLVSVALLAHADRALPPWSDASDLPVPKWAKSVAPHDDDTPVFRIPSRVESRRGTLDQSARPPLYGALRGQGCNGRWLQIGPAAWVCSDEVELAADDPPPARVHQALPKRYADDGLGFHYAFVGPEGAHAYRDLLHAEEEAAAADLDPGFAVAIVDEQDAHGQRWAKTSHGKWIAVTELFAGRPVTLHGEAFGPGEPMDVAWVMPDHAPTFSDAKGGKGSGARARFDLVHRYEEASGFVRISADGAPTAEWVRARDLTAPTTSAPPDEVGGKDAVVRWIDVELATHTLVAYEGTRPVYAALVATGRGPQGSETATPRGVHRIWVKLRSSSMGNLGDEDAETHYSIEDVPYVQFFAKGVALHGAFWHHSFGAAHSHGCVNLAPVDARWLFEFTSPDLPVGWSAVLPAAPLDLGTVVRVR